SGMTKNPEVRFAKSIVDYIFRWMATKFLSPEAQFRVGVNMQEPGVGTRDSGPAASGPAAGTPGTAGAGVSRPETRPRTSEFAAMRNQEDAPPCSTCGSI